MPRDSGRDFAAGRVPPTPRSAPRWWQRWLRRWRPMPQHAAAPGPATPRPPDAAANFAETQPSCHFL